MTVTFGDISTGLTIDGMPKVISRALACSGNGILIVDATQPSCPIIYANTVFCRMTGYTLDEVLGKNCRFLQNDDTDQPELAILREAIAQHQEAEVVVRNYRKDGSLFWNRLRISPVADETGNVTHFVGVQTDVTEQKCAEEKLRLQATHDALTGLPNRQLFRRELEETIQQAQSEQHLVALLVLNIDHFKLVNNSLGYDIADMLLHAVAQRLSSCTKDIGSVSRHGVDEFAIVLKGTHAARDVATAAEKIARAMSGPFLINEETIRITCSIGISLYPQDGSDAAALLRYANMALHRAKELGRNNIQFFASELNERTLERVRLEVALRSAIEKQELSLHYQPLVDLQTGKLAGLEALARWNSAELGTISPTRFIAVAEESELIEQIGEWALRRACADIRAWIDSGAPAVRVAVNVSPRQFRDPFLADKVSAALRDARIEPSLLSLEITENVFMQDTAASEATLARLQGLGVDLALDDFGTGFSSLSYLKRYPFRKVKIDCSFVENIVTDADDAAISKAVISMAHSLGIRVVAEGVETEAQCDFLRRNMCDEIQGFLFSAAIAPENMSAFLCEGRRLPDHLLRLERPPRTLLLVDDETNIVSALKRLLRPDNYTILTANSGQEGLEILKKNEVDVIVSDQRMPGMTGVEFLGKAKEIYPDTVRIVLSGYTELQSVMDAVNEGAIYKFLMKPWDDKQLRAHIEEAFHRKEMADENRRLDLEVRTANFELAVANRRLEEVLQQQQQQIKRDAVSLDVVREVLQHAPLPVIGLDEEDFIVFVNGAAQSLFYADGFMLGCDAREMMPDLFDAIGGEDSGTKPALMLKGAVYHVLCHRMGKDSESRGMLITLTKE